MKYKAIVFDVDGTAVPLAANVASSRLQSVIAEAQKTIIISAATGRSYEHAKPIFTSLGLISPSVMQGGSTIIDPKTDEIIWNKSMAPKNAKLVLDKLTKYQSDIYVGVDPIHKALPIKELKPIHKAISVIYALAVPTDQVKELIEDIHAVKGIVGHATPSWTKGMMDVHITNAEATKQHGIEVLIDMLGLNKSEVIGVGDSGNDLPIFKATGHRIAMGNAESILKEQADEIAPSVVEDGLAQIIEKYFI